MHSTGFEPVMFQRKTDYESGAFNHSATNAKVNDKFYKQSTFLITFLFLRTNLILKYQKFLPL